MTLSPFVGFAGTIQEESFIGAQFKGSFEIGYKEKHPGGGRDDCSFLHEFKRTYDRHEIIWLHISFSLLNKTIILSMEMMR